MVAAALAVLPAAAAERWTEGVHYELVENPEPRAEGAPIEVIEALWYGCPICYNLEPHLARWLETKPDDVEFVRLHASLSPSWRIPARAFYAAEALGVTDQVHQALFDTIHQGRSALNDMAVLDALFEQHAGIDRETFRAAYSSSKIDYAMRDGDARLRKFLVRGVPTLIVAGKYRTTPGRAGGYPETIELLDHLIELERNP